MRRSADLGMNSELFIVLLLAISWTHCVQCQLPFDKDFNCKTAASQEVNLTALSGYWYEAVRAPNVDVLKCLNVSVPATVDKELELRLEYISTINGKVEFVNETQTFPWDERTANGTFILQYNGLYLNMSVTYKLIYADPNAMTILCGYTGISSVPFFKLFSRDRQINPVVIDYINKQVDKAGYLDYIIWTEQSPDRCNAAVRPATGAITILGLAIVWALCSWH